MKSRLTLATIAAAKPFCDVLAQHVLAKWGADPLILTRLLILLPSRRACRTLREAFLRASEGRPLLLPSIQPLGDVEEEETFFATLADSELAGELAAMAPAIPAVKRRLLLAELILAQYDQGLNLQRPNMAQALLQADALAELFDEIEREKLDFSHLASIVPEDLSNHWQVTYGFLERIAQAWPDVLAREGYEDATRRRNRMLNILCRHWSRRPPDYPVIAAGSTGSIAATAELMEVIAGLPNGMVVLPGLDREMSEKAWEQLTETHPQYGLSRLLGQLQVPRQEVALLDIETVSAASHPARTELMREALHPAESLASWQEVRIDPHAATDGLNYCVAHTAQEEARLIAVLLREVLETPGRTAALVTRDRSLARRVMAQMQRFGIHLNDSAGQSLASTPAARFLLLAAECLLQRAAPVPLLALLKHPLALAGQPPGALRNLVRQMEMTMLRGVRREKENLLQAIAAQSAGTALGRFAQSFAAAIEPLSKLFHYPAVPLRTLLAEHLRFTEWLSASEGGARLWEGHEGAALASFIEELMTHELTLSPLLYPALLQTLLEQQTIRPLYGLHPRLFILSPIEARLQQFDRIVLGGLNEGNWPPAAEASPWLSRPMQRQFGLAVPERRIGQAAHDFSLLALGREVFLTRSEKEGDSPATASRWLVRLETLLIHLQGGKEAQWPHTPHAAYAQQLDAPVSLPAIPPAAGNPPAEARPRKFTVTDIERLMRDPYAIYARHVLTLKPLQELDMEPDASDFGQLVHNALEHFVRAHPQQLPPDAEALLLEYGKAAFTDWWNVPVARNYWWPRFEQIAHGFIQQEILRREALQSVHAELRGQWQCEAGGETFQLITRIDRLETLKDGSLHLLDYKTGGHPSRTDVAMGIASQLPLEALIIRHGEVSGAPQGSFIAPLSDLSYWKLIGSKAGIQSMVEKEGSAEQLMEEALRGTSALLQSFARTGQPYWSTPVPGRAPVFSDYDHLVRKAEWEATQ